MRLAREIDREAPGPRCARIFFPRNVRKEEWRMQRIVWMLAALACALGASAATATINGGGGPTAVQCNYDLTNTGSKAAFDVAIVLQGSVSFSEFYNGVFGGAPTVTTAGGYTTLHWTSPPNAIGTNDKIHVGYTPAGTSDCPVVDIYWTDENGSRIPSSFVGTAWNHLTSTSVTITNRSFHTIQVRDVRWACQATALPLAALNASNDYLSRSMVAIGDAATLAPGESWVIPVQPSCSQCYCVTNFQTTADEPGAIFSPWVQEFLP
jgi:hypothetical protein